MSTAERNLSPTDSPPTTRPPHPKVSRWAYVLIVIGVLSLFDLIGLDNWGTPLVMIVVGVALLTRQYSWGRMLSLMLMSTVVIASGGWYFTHPTGTQSQGTQSPGTQTVTWPLTAARAEVQLSTTIGRLDVAPSSSGTLIDGTFDLDRNDRLDRAFSSRGDTQVVRLAVRRTGPGVVLPWMNSTVNTRWNIGLTPRVPLILKVDTGVGESTLDLEGLQVTDLTLNVGVGKSTVHLPATGTVTASIDGGVGKIDITIPRGMQSRVRVNSGVGTVSVLGDFQHDGDTYTSNGYAGARNRVDLRIEGGVGKITVEQAGR